MYSEKSHISICICTYKRPLFLENLLIKLQNQRTDALFEFSLVVVDNDHLESARSVVENIKKKSLIPIGFMLSQNKILRSHETKQFKMHREFYCLY